MITVTAPHWVKILSTILLLLTCYAIIGELLCGYWEGPYPVQIVSGPQKFRGYGNVVSSPSFVNHWNWRMTLNVAATEEEIREKYGPGWGDRIEELIDKMHRCMGPRHWVTVWSSDVERICNPDRTACSYVHIWDKDNSGFCVVCGHKQECHPGKHERE